MFIKIKEIPSPDEVKNIQSFSAAQLELKKQRDKQIVDIIAGKDNRVLIIIGPCSADNEEAVCEYARRLAEVNEKVKDKLMLVPRVYTGKPRTKGEGYKGIFHSPDPKKGTDITEGIFAMRKMLIRVMSESGFTAADEMLYPENYDYVEDLLSYVAIGARSCENQYHRLVASGIDVPVGIKNPMNGSLAVLLDSIHAAQIPNEFKYNGLQVKTYGNPNAHAILRGAVDLNGVNVANYHYENIVNFAAMYEKSNLKNPAIIVDVNHSNSNKRALQQTRIIDEILLNIKADPVYGKLLKGFMIESYIEDGRQEIDSNVYGKSITDECLGWEKTERLLYQIAESI